MSNGHVAEAGDTMRQIHDHPSGEPAGQGGHDDAVEELCTEQLADVFDWIRLNDLAGGLHRGPAKPCQLELEPALGQ